MGKILLANLPEEMQREQLEQIMRSAKRGPNTIVSRDDLRDELADVLADGFAVNDEELESGQHAISVPIRDGDREVVAAVSLTAATRTITLEELIDGLQPHLQVTADRISRTVGLPPHRHVVGASENDSHAPCLLGRRSERSTSEADRRL